MLHSANYSHSLRTALLFNNCNINELRTAYRSLFNAKVTYLMINPHVYNPWALFHSKVNAITFMGICTFMLFSVNINVLCINIWKQVTQGNPMMSFLKLTYLAWSWLQRKEKVVLCLSFVNGSCRIFFHYWPLAMCSSRTGCYFWSMKRVALFLGSEPGSFLL